MKAHCPTKGCPFPPDEHRNWCGHQGTVTHLHWPKKGMGGKNPKSKIVALACWPCHDKIDNFGGNIITKDLPGKGLTTWATDVKGNELFEKRLEAGSAAAKEDKTEVAVGRCSVAKSSAAAPPASGESSAAELVGGSDNPDIRRPSMSPSSAAPFSLDDWCAEGMQLVYFGIALRDGQDEVRFRIGDWFNRGEGFLSDEVYGYLRGFEDVTVRQYSWVAARVAPDTRVLELPWTFHRAVAALEPPKQKEWLNRAKEENLSSKGLYQAIHGKKTMVKRWSLEEMRTSCLQQHKAGVEPHSDKKPTCDTCVAVARFWAGLVGGVGQEFDVSCASSGG